MKVGRGVLIPRPETELLVDLAKEYCNRNSTVFDLCAGTGCIGIAIAKETGCEVTAIEKSDEAVVYLKQNVALNNVDIKIIQADILENTYNADCILINAPYLSKAEMQSLQKEVTHEPESALFGGDDGLGFYRSFFERWSEALTRAAFVACEVGDTQAEAVCEMMRGIGLNPQVKRDYNGIDRVVYSVKS